MFTTILTVRHVLSDKTQGSFDTDEFETKSHSKTFIGLWFSGFCYFMALGFVSPFMPLLLQSSKLTYFEIGVIYMIGLIFPILLQTFWGNITDKTGRKTIIILAVAVASVVSAVYPHASSFIQFLTLVLLWNTFVSAATTATPALAVDTVGSTDVGKFFGRYRISGSIGWIISTAIGGLVSTSFGIEVVFYLASAFFWLSAIIIKVSVSEQPKIKIDDKKGNFQFVRNKNFLMFLLTIFMVNISATTFSNFLSLYTRELGGSDAIVGLAFSIAALAEVPCMVYFGAVSDKIGRKVLVAAALFIYPLRLYLYTTAKHPYLILPIQLLHGFTFGMLYVSSIAFVSDIAPEGKGTALGLYNSFSSAGLAVGSGIAGAISNSYGMIAMYQFMAVFSLAPAFFFAFAVKETLRVEHKIGDKKHMRER
ncbi:MAG: MFS transporter [Candidatus Bathyarchaeia archaeon]